MHVTTRFNTRDLCYSPLIHVYASFIIANYNGVTGFETGNLLIIKLNMETEYTLIKQSKFDF